MGIRIATFNLENLFSRFDFGGRVSREARVVGSFAVPEKDEYEILRMAFEAVASDDTRQLTALAMADARADLFCLQEVDSQQALDIFNANYLRPVLRQRFAQATKGWDEADRHAHDAEFFYDYRHVISGNDTRGIDVGVMSKRPVGLKSNAAITYEFLSDAPLDWAALEEHGIQRSDRVLRRDCLMIDVEVDGAELTIFNCHLKSMNGNGSIRSGSDRRAHSQVFRLAEVWAIRKLVELRFLGHAERANWIICGDFNDFVDVDGVPAQHSALGPFFENGFAIDPMRRRNAMDRWTHYYAEGDSHVQLDYILLSPKLAQANPDVVPEVIRKGLPHRVPRIEHEDRYPRIGWARPKASDHCPVVIEIEVPK